MKKFIDSELRRILGDFKIEISNMGSLCDLKEFSFRGGSTPNYNEKAIQQLYLLRYFPAYLVEYSYLYSQIRGMNFLANRPNILSIGCGAGVDYYALKFAEIRSFRYTGIDRIEWGYFDKVDNNECYFIHNDICTWQSLDESEYNIIIFPKSIGEFSKQEFATLLRTIRTSQFDEPRIIVVSSVRENGDIIDALE